jgi:Cupin-like domain
MKPPYACRPSSLVHRLPSVSRAALVLVFAFLALFFGVVAVASVTATPPPFDDVRPIQRLVGSAVSVADFYGNNHDRAPAVFTNATQIDPTQWTRRNLYRFCGDTVLMQPHKNPQLCSTDDNSNSSSSSSNRSPGQNPACHHVRIVHTDLVGQTWGGTTVADITKLRFRTVRDVLTVQDRSPLGYEIVLFDAPLLHHCPSLKDTVHVPKYFPRDYYLFVDRLLGKDPAKTRNWPSIIVSKKGGGTFLHADSGMTRFWAQQLSGRKRWRVFPLADSYDKLYPTQHMHYYYPILFHVDAFDPNFTAHPKFRSATVYETITEPGDLIYIPEGWAHQVQNLEDSVLTSMNFLDARAVETANLHLPYNLHSRHNPELFSAFFFPLDLPKHDGANLSFEQYFAQRFLDNETSVPESVLRWVEIGGTAAIDSEWDARGLAALHVAVSYNYYVVLDYLITECGANANALSQTGWTPLDYAELTGNWAMRNFLLSYDGVGGRLHPTPSMSET